MRLVCATSRRWPSFRLLAGRQEDTGAVAFRFAKSDCAGQPGRPTDASTMSEIRPWLFRSVRRAAGPAALTVRDRRELRAGKFDPIVVAIDLSAARAGNRCHVELTHTTRFLSARPRGRGQTDHRTSGTPGCQGYSAYCPMRRRSLESDYWQYDPSELRRHRKVMPSVRTARTCVGSSRKNF